jgi:hypothetical protein
MFARITAALGRFNLPSIAEVERDYLNAAVSRTDLARRMREVDVGKFRRSQFDL